MEKASGKGRNGGGGVVTECVLTIGPSAAAFNGHLLDTVY